MRLEDAQGAAVFWVATNSNRHPDGEICFPPKVVGADEATRKIFIRTLLRLEAVVDSVVTLNQLRRDYKRASGDCVCQWCGFKFYDHPADVANEPDVVFGGGLTIICDKSRVKL